MSTPTEQARAVIAAEEFLRDLAASDGDPRARRTMRPLARRARAIRRHLPTPAEWAIVLTCGGSYNATMVDEFRRESERRRTARKP